LLGGLVAAELGIGFAEVRKDVKPSEVGEGVVRRVSPPDYLGRSLDLSMRRHLLAERDRVLFVDEWVDTGAQVSTVARLVDDVGTTWVGAAVIVDVGPNDVRHRLDVRSLLRSHDLPW
jgi:adenine phosphoribosyltransferase